MRFQRAYRKRSLVMRKRPPTPADSVPTESHEYAGTVAKLRAQLIDYLRNTEDPRFTDKPDKFETYRYYGRL